MSESLVKKVQRGRGFAEKGDLHAVMSTLAELEIGVTVLERQHEGMCEIFRRVKARLEAGRHINRLDRDSLLESINAYLAGP